MSDKDETKKVEDLTPITEDLTKNQLQKLRETAADENNQIVESGDRSTAVTKRLRILQAYVRSVDEALEEINGVEFSKIEAPAEPEPVVKEPVKEPVEETEKEETVPAVVEEAEEITKEAGELIAASAKVPAAGTGVVETPKPVETGDLQNDAPIFASYGKADASETEAGERTNFFSVGKRLRGLRTEDLGRGERVNLMRVDKLPDETVPRLGENIQKNTAIMAEAKESSIQAAADLSICGQPLEIQVQGCPTDNSTPFLDALSGNSVAAANICAIKWKKPLGLSDIDVPPGLWTTCDQENVDPADKSTWKPLATLKNTCPEECSVVPIDTVMGLKVEINDEICRPDSIRQANEAIECLLAVQLEKSAMAKFDQAVTPANHFSVDASAYGGIGAVPALTIILHQLFASTGLDRKSRAQNYWAAIHPSILKTLALDLELAGEGRGSGLDVLRDTLSRCGVTNIIVTKEFGNCEGQLVEGLPIVTQDCTKSDGTNCDATDVEADCVAFGAGEGVLPGLPSDTRIRLFDPSDWYHGSTFLVDYALRKSPEMLRQNCGEYFGERRDFLFNASSCDAQQFVLDASSLCANGQRVKHDTVLPCTPVLGTAKPLATARPAAKTATKKA